VTAQVGTAAGGAGGVQIGDRVLMLGVGVIARGLSADVLRVGGDERLADQVVVGARGRHGGQAARVGLARHTVLQRVDRQVDRVEVVGVDLGVDLGIR